MITVWDVLLILALIAFLIATFAPSTTTVGGLRVHLIAAGAALVTFAVLLGPALTLAR